MGERTDYSVTQKVIHWLMALLITLDLFVAQKFGNEMEEWDRLESRSDHASVGTILTLLFILRLYYRFKHGAPPLPTGMPPWQVTAARAGHFLLYFFIGVLIASGIATGMNAANPITPFGLADITLGQANEDTFALLRPIHEFATNAVIILAIGHVLAALYHHFVSKDDSTTRMLRFWRSE